MKFRRPTARRRRQHARRMRSPNSIALSRLNSDHLGLARILHTLERRERARGLQQGGARFVGRVPSRGALLAFPSECVLRASRSARAEAKRMVPMPHSFMNDRNRATPSWLWCYAGIRQILPGSQSRRCPEAHRRGRPLQSGALNAKSAPKSAICGVVRKRSAPTGSVLWLVPVSSPRSAPRRVGRTNLYLERAFKRVLRKYL